MISLVRRHTSELDEAQLGELRELLVRTFGSGFDQHNWDHALGGIHVLIRLDGRLVAHGSVVQRRLLHAGRALRCGYVEAVATHPDFQRRGLGGQVMRELGAVIAGAYEIGGLSASDEGRRLYEQHGWRRWRGRTFVLSPAGVMRTQDDDDSVMVLPLQQELDLHADITADWRDGDAW